jgi:hypothetical protein
MPSISSLLKSLRQDYPELTFESADEFWWSGAKQTVFYDPKAADATAYSLHELSHALLRHEGYERDIELIKLERDAWAYAKNTLAPQYDIEIDDDLIQDNLDTYRTWLHARSMCPDCEATGLQMKHQQYRCLACGHTWRVNEARLCALRRYSLQAK